MANVIADAIKNLLGGLGELTLYTRQQADQLIGVAKQLEENVNPTIDHIRAQGRIVRANADIRVAQLENVVTTAKAATDVAVAAADAIEVVAEQSQRYAAAEARVRNVAANVTPAYAAMLSGRNLNAEPRQISETQNSFLQLPHRR
jgi:N-methylhydantoinase A/oxoprolinase/acetone carboxylase beta subunit